MKQIGLILLAAGSSLRYHGIKLLDTIDGKKMYCHIMDQMKTVPFVEKVIVTQYEEIAEAAALQGYHVRLNHHPEEGISRSIHLGLEEMLRQNPSIDMVMFSVCDQPYLKKSTILKLVTTCNERKEGIICTCYGDKIGNPCVFQKKYFEELMKLTGDVGGKKIVKLHQDDSYFIQAESDRELVDIDTRINTKNF